MNKGDFCLIGHSNLEFNWLIRWNFVNSFQGATQRLPALWLIYGCCSSCKLLVSSLDHEMVWMQIAGFVNTLVTTYFYRGKFFGGKFFKWTKIVGSDRQCTKPPSKKNYSVGHHETWETHSKMSFPGIVFILNSFRHRIELVFNKASWVLMKMCVFPRIKWYFERKMETRTDSSTGENTKLACNS